MSNFLTNRFFDTDVELRQMSRAKSFSRPLSVILNVVQDGKIMDPYYRDVSEKGSTKGRKQHLGVDITGPTAGNGSMTDPRRGLPVYSTIRTNVELNELNNARPFNKNSSVNMNDIGLPASGSATMVEATVALQPWSSQDDHSYGGIVGFSCVYAYANSSGGTAEFTLYIEYLHLITEKFLPKDSTGRIASLNEWSDTGRGIGFNPHLKNSQKLDPVYFLGPSYGVIGYLGATQTPHVHVQAAFFNRKTLDKKTSVRIDPLAAIW